MMNEYRFDYMNYINNISLDKMNKENYNVNHSKKTNEYKEQILDFYKDYDMNKTKKNDDQILVPYQGFIRGNMFDSLYDLYKNYKPKELDPSTERETLLYQLMQYKFALKDLNLYLDTNPNDKNAIELFNKYLKIEKQTSDKYEKMYGPLVVNSDNVNDNSWEWVNSPWPWEGV